MPAISRRKFLKVSAGFLVSSFLVGCGLDPQAASKPPESRSGRLILQNEDRAGFFIRWYQPFEAPQVETWSLKLEGKVRRPQSLTLADLRALPKVAQNSRMRCVEGWSVAARWEGVRLQTLLDLVQPEPGATWVKFLCADGYEESSPVEELLKSRILLAYGMNKELLTSEYGAPLRLIVPAKYGYKGAKAITHIVWDTSASRGTWPRTGHYTAEGDILAGMDVPLDLSAPRVNSAGEIFYADGLESKPVEN